MKYRAHDDAMAEVFHRDPAYVIKLLHSILEDGAQGELLIALSQLRGKVTELEKAQEATHG